jgi:hypothetical protein
VVGTDLGFHLVCDQVSARSGCCRSLVGISVWHGGNPVAAVLCFEGQKFEVLGASAWFYRATGTAPVLDQLPYFLLGDRIADFRNRSIDVLHRNSSARNQHNKIPVVQTNTWGMAYGALFMAIFAVASGVPFNYDPSFSYSPSLIYLAVFGSIFAFGAYLTLIGRIGAYKTAYAAVLFPVIALGISTVFEDYQWTLRALFGFALVLLGNYIVLTRARNQAG